jgi:hypothetical protein
MIDVGLAGVVARAAPQVRVRARSVRPIPISSGSGGGHRLGRRSPAQPARLGCGASNSHQLQTSMEDKSGVRPAAICGAPRPNLNPRRQSSPRHAHPPTQKVLGHWRLLATMCDLTPFAWYAWKPRPSCYAARRSPLRGKAGEPVSAPTGRIGRPHYSAMPSATLHRLSESGRISHAHHRDRAVGQFVSTARERSRGGPTATAYRYTG